MNKILIRQLESLWWIKYSDHVCPQFPRKIEEYSVSMANLSCNATDYNAYHKYMGKIIQNTKDTIYRTIMQYAKDNRRSISMYRKISSVNVLSDASNHTYVSPRYNGSLE